MSEEKTPIISVDAEGNILSYQDSVKELIEEGTTVEIVEEPKPKYKNKKTYKYKRRNKNNKKKPVHKNDTLKQILTKSIKAAEKSGEY